MQPNFDESANVSTAAKPVWPVRLALGVLHFLQDTLFIRPRDIQTHFARSLDYKEMQLLHKMGQRVPNSLWWRRVKNRNTKQAVVPAIGIVLSIAFMWSKFLPLPPYSPNGNLTLQVIATDLFLLFGVSMTAATVTLLSFAIFRPRVMQLRNIRHMRRRSTAPSMPKKRTLFFQRIPVWPIAALVGVAMYVALVAPAIGVGATPPWLVGVSAAIGHARIAPILVFPVAAEWIDARWKRRQRKTERA